MKISEILEADDKKLTVDQAAQLYTQHGDALSSSAIVLAKQIHANSGLDAHDAISMAKELVADRERSKKVKKPDADKPVRSPMTRSEPTATDKTTDRVSKSGKKWGNQYYADPADQRTKSRPSTRYRDLKKTVSDKIGKIARKDELEFGKDVAADITGALDSIMNLGKRKNSR